MRDTTFRTIGATVVLVGIAVVAILQIDLGGDASAIALESDVAITDSTTTIVTTRSEQTTTTEPAPFTYRLAVLAGISTDNFWAFYGAQASVWNAYILGPTKPALYSHDTSDGSLNPELAADDAIPFQTDSGWAVNVALNADLAWSDGEPVSAQDVVFTFQTVRSLGLGGSWAEAFPSEIVDIEATSEHSLTITFSNRPNLRIWPYSVGLAPIMPAHIWRELVTGKTEGDLYAMSGGVDVGGGPMAIATVADDLVVSIANPGYGIGEWPDTVEYHVFGDETAAVEALEAGEVDAVLTPKGLTEEHLAAVSGNDSISVLNSPVNGVRYLGFNLDREPMSDRAFRAALALLLDRQALAESTSGSVANSFVSAFNEQWFDASAVEANTAPYGGDVGARLDAALSLLGAAGYQWDVSPLVDETGQVVPGTGLTINGIPSAPLTILTSGDAYDPVRPLYADEISDVLGWLGFDVRPVETDFDTVVDLTFTPGDDGLLHYDMYLLGWTLGNPSLPDYYRPLFASDGVSNNTGYESETFMENLTAYENSLTYDEARSALWAMEAVLSADLPYLLLYTSDITEVYRSDRVTFDIGSPLGGLQGRLGGLSDVRPIG